MLAGTLLGRAPVMPHRPPALGEMGAGGRPYGLAAKRSGGVRFVAIIFLLVLAGLVGLFIYGQMMEPDLREIEVEATHAAQ